MTQPPAGSRRVRKSEFDGNLFAYLDSKGHGQNDMRRSYYVDVYEKFD